MKLKKSSWHYKYNKWFGSDIENINLCPYFWLTVLNIISFPIVLINKIKQEIYKYFRNKKKQKRINFFKQIKDDNELLKYVLSMRLRHGIGVEDIYLDWIAACDYNSTWGDRIWNSGVADDYRKALIMAQKFRERYFNVRHIIQKEESKFETLKINVSNKLAAYSSKFKKLCPKIEWE